MARLRNRIVKADYFTDGELLRWHRDKRQTYRGLWAMAEDSGCLEDDQFEWKLALWPSPMDSDIDVEILTRWRDELVEARKLIPYEADGKRYLYIRTFHQHEHPRNPQSPDLPLPPWVRMDVSEGTGKDGKKWTRVLFVDCTESVQTPYKDSTASVLAPQSGPVRTNTDQAEKRRVVVDEHPVENDAPRSSSASSEDETTPPTPLLPFSHELSQVIPKGRLRAAIVSQETAGLNDSDLATYADLHRQLQRLLRRVESVVAPMLGEFSGDDLAQRIRQARQWALADLKGADNPAAVINSRLRAGDTADLGITDERLRELRRRHRGGAKKRDGEATAIGETVRTLVTSSAESSRTAEGGDAE